MEYTKPLSSLTVKRVFSVKKSCGAMVQGELVHNIETDSLVFFEFSPFLKVYPRTPHACMHEAFQNGFKTLKNYF